MPFVNEKELKKQDKLIDTYLSNKKILKERLQEKALGKQKLQESASEIFYPITKKIEETQKKTDERQDKLIQDIQHQLVIEQKPRSKFTVDFESNFNDEEKKLLAQDGFEIDLVTLIQGGPSFIADLNDKAKVANQRLGGQRRRHDADTDMIDKKIQTLKKYRNKLNKLLGGLDLTVGRGFSKKNDPNKLCERLHLLVSAKQAGNNNKRLTNEITSILAKLKPHVSNIDHKKLCGVILK